MRLGDWLAKKKKTQVAFAAEIGARKSDVSRWVRRQVRPSWDVLPKIIDATAGEVTANDFLPPPEVDSEVNGRRRRPGSA